MDTANPAPSQSGNSAGFTKLITEVMPGVAKFRASREYAIELGVDEQVLERFASRACSDYESRLVKEILIKNTWSRTYLVNLIKQRRT